MLFALLNKGNTLSILILNKKYASRMNYEIHSNNAKEKLHLNEICKLQNIITKFSKPKLIFKSKS